MSKEIVIKVWKEMPRRSNNYTTISNYNSENLEIVVEESFDDKEKLKEIGAKFDKSKKAWVFIVGKDMNKIKETVDKLVNAVTISVSERTFEQLNKVGLPATVVVKELKVEY
ncbi:MAG TPA: hypothetical protein GX497_03505 [Bacillus bacterium]|nr:hypothetical protein [Bacillus sp. (in: firmicutes)]